MRKTIVLTMGFILALGLAACDVGPYALRITLPDQDARDQVNHIRVWVIEPGELAGCGALLSQESQPGDAGYTVEKDLDFTYPATGDIGDLSDVGAGQRLFYAEAENASGQVILNGCVSMEAGVDGPDSVTIDLDWLACEQSNGGVEICDGRDNDCNDLVDDGAPADLCVDREQATAIACTESQCQYECLEGWFDADDSMANGCECRQTRGGEEYCDDLDNDCDGTVDGTGCISCNDDSDCSAPGDCMSGTCSGGTCQMTHFPDDTDCNDGDGCTENESCQGGFCLGEDKDCSDGQDCTEDSCTPSTGACNNMLMTGFCLIDDTCVANGQTQVGNSCRSCNTAHSTGAWQTLDAGTSCDDGLWCTGTEACDAMGECQHSDLPCDATCIGGCDEGSQSCSFDEVDTDCDDGFSCTDNDACDGQGNCQGQAIEDYCNVDQECLPECASDSLGCVDRPNFVVINCPSEASTTGEALCSLELNGGGGLEDCLHCQLELLPSIISSTDFYATDCSLGDWALQVDAACSSSSLGSCPFSMNAPLTDCADTYVCNSGDRTIEFRRADYAPGGWRLEQTFDFSSYEKVRVCYGAKQSPEPFGGSLEILTDPGDELNGNVVDCLGPGSLASAYPTYPCVELPGSVVDMEQTRLSFLAQVNADDAYNLLGMSSIRVSAYPPECNQEVAVMDESFAGCGHDITGSYNGWNFSQPANCVETQSQCGNIGGLLLGTAEGLSSPQINASYELDLRSYVSPGRLCWTEFATAGFGGEYRLNFHSIGGSAAWHEDIYDSQMPPTALNPTCRNICIDVKSQYLVMGGDGFGLGINGSTSDGYMLLSNFRLHASQACDATGVLDISEVEEDGSGGHQVRVSSSQGLPRRARVTCTWGNEGMQTRREIEFKTSNSRE